MLLPTDEIRAVPRSNAAECIAYAARNGAIGPYREWIETADEFSRRLGLDPIVVFFQAEVTTKCFQTPEWLAGNTTGMDIATDPLIPGGYEAALLHVGTLWMAMGGSVFPVEIPMRRTFRNWVGFTLDSRKRDRQRPLVVRVEDLAKKYEWQPGVWRYLWSTDATYANRLCARAMLSRIKIPSQRYLQKTNYFAQPKIIRSTLRLPITEGPVVANNRILGWLEPGSQFVAVGDTRGHAPMGNAKWYVMDAPMYGYVHSKGTVEVV